MSTKVATYDVFLSYSLPEARTAELVELALKEAGLDVFNAARAEVGEGPQDVLWRALAESAAIVVIMPPENAPASSVVFEVGASTAWHKPIYIVHTGTGNAKLPSYLAEFPAYPVSRIDDAVQSVKQIVKHGFPPFSDDGRALLIDVYQQLAIPTDKLLQDPASLDILAREFEKRSGTRFAGERLWQELVRLRKSGNLPRRRKANPGER
jgi:hypothetical protein